MTIRDGEAETSTSPFTPILSSVGHDIAESCRYKFIAKCQ